MNFSMTFSAIDKASKVMGKIMASEKKMAATMKSNAAKTNRANAKTQRSLSRTERTMASLSRGARRSFKVVTDGARKASDAVKTLHKKSVALGKIGGGQIGAGAGKVAKGAKVVSTGLLLLYGSAALAAGGLVGTASEFEKFQTILETTEGSAGKAQKAMDWVTNFAVKTPYELDQVTDSFVKLRAYGLDPTQGLLTSLGDTSAAMGKPLMQAVEAVADAVTGENERLKEFGIKASKSGKTITYEYTNSLGKSVQASVKATDRMGIQQKLMEIMNEKYAGSMGRLSKTWDGMMSNLADQWMKFQLMIMKSGLFDWMKGKLSDILDKINEMEADGSLQRWATSIGESIQSALTNAWNFGVAVYDIFKSLKGHLSSAAEYVGGWKNLGIILAGIAFAPTLIGTAAGLVQIAVGLSALTAALMANPIVLIIALIAGAAYLIYRNWDKIGPYFQSLWEGVKSYASIAWEWLKTLFSWTPLGRIIANWSGIKDAMSNPIQMGKDAVAKVWEWFKVALSWSPTALVISNWDGITNAIGQSIDAAKAMAQAAWDGVKAVFSGKWLPDMPSFDWDGAVALQSLKDTWSSVTGWLGDTAAGLWDLIPDMPEFSLPSWFGGGDDIANPKTLLAAADAAQKLEKQYPALTTAANGALKGTQVAVTGIHDLLSKTDFTDRGVALMRTLAAGIRQGTGLVVAATAAATQKVRDHLPSSPAKTGPLSDIHRLKFGETIASSIRGEPMVKAMRAATAATLAAALPVTQNMAIASAAIPTSAAKSVLPSASEARSASVPAFRAGSGDAGSDTRSISVSYGDINIGSATPEALAQFKEELAKHRREMKRLIDRETAREKRKDF